VSRFLFVVPPLAGHAYPAAAVAAALRAGGHDVAWVGSESYLRPLVGEQTTVYPTGLRPYRGQQDRGARAMKSLWEGFVVPFARAVRPAVERAVEAYRPDVLVADQHALAGAAVAHQRGLRWATLCPQAMELTRPFQDRPKIEAWIRGQIAALAPGVEIDLRFSPYLVVAFTGPPLTGPAQRFPDHFALVGPAVGDRPPVPGFPWPALDPARRLLLVTMGTLAQDLAVDFYGRMVEALRPLGGRLQAIVVAPAGAVPDPPDHLLVLPRAPVPQLLPRLAAVVCHAGLNTTCEALAQRVPLVLAPIKHDQPIIASQVVSAGAGIRVRFGRATPERLRAAVTGLLDDPSYRAAAARVAGWFAAAGGAPAAADRLARLARPDTTTVSRERVTGRV
jgi:UDP:flavonoid glycosyltransferase YjiC (YdhE family)